MIFALVCTGERKADSKEHRDVNTLRQRFTFREHQPEMQHAFDN